MTSEAVALEERLQELGGSFWRWRTVQQPRSRDDIPRLERPEEWFPDWSAAAVARAHDEVERFDHVHRSIDVDGAPVELAVDHALIGSAIARALFELDVLRSWRRQPSFYVDQTLGVVFDLLVVHGELDQPRAQRVLRALQAVPAGLSTAKVNLEGSAVDVFAGATVEELGRIETQIASVADALAAQFPADLRPRLLTASDEAGRALGSFRDWLAAGGAGLRHWEPVGQANLDRFLRDVALVPFSAAELLALARTEHARAVALSVAEATRAVSDVDPIGDVEALVHRAADDEQATRAFYEGHGILSQPSTLGHYLMARMPGYLEPLSWLGVTDDLTSESRVDENGIRYLPPMADDLPYFFAAAAKDPRSMIAHEGVHYQQLAMAWRHPNALRRRYYDSCANEGIAFYHEEMMLQAGYFGEDSPTRASIFSFMRLRALRVEVDVRLAIGDMTLDEARDYLVTAVPMDSATAAEEAVMFAAAPGLGLSYQVGKVQIQQLLADVAQAEGPAFDLCRFHDFLWRNGNVPIALQRMELLGGAGRQAGMRASER